MARAAAKQTRARHAGAAADAPATEYSVTAGGSASPARLQAGSHDVDAPTRPRRVAVLVAHGMGQQIPFQTQDEVAEGLRRRCPGTPAPRACTVKEGEDWLHCIRLQLQREGRDVHADIYEAYWAPLTEGKVTTRDVIGFLACAAGNGIANGSRAFRRWLMGQYVRFDPPIRIVLYLLGALLVLLSLVLMNATVAIVAAARSVLNERPPGWLGDALLRDLTTTFNIVVTVMAAFALALWFGTRLRRWLAGTARPLLGFWGACCVVLFVLALAVIALAGVAIVLLFLGHTGGQAAGGQLWHEVLPAAGVDAFNRGFDRAVLWAGALALLLLLVPRGWKILVGLGRDWTDPHRWLTLLSAGFLVVLAALAAVLAWAMLGASAGSAGAGALAVVASGLSWPLLVGASAVVRSLLVQYMGDVAIYVRPYKLDRHYQLRDDIRQCAFRVARAIYARQEDGRGYDEVIVVAHSLGSVVAYDVLNRLVLEDNAGGHALGVARRTGLFLTFGSPLDKTAFLFGVQGHHTSEAREALAASVQPLITDYAFRPRRWVNIHSPWDVISGPLEFYDLPGPRGPQHVENLRDPDASTLLVAHTEYATGPLLFDTLLAALLPPAPAR